MKNKLEKESISIKSHHFVLFSIRVVVLGCRIRKGVERWWIGGKRRRIGGKRRRIGGISDGISGRLKCRWLSWDIVIVVVVVVVGSTIV